MRIALVTGAGIRVGKAVAIALAQEGYHVICHANRSVGAVKEVVAALSRMVAALSIVLLICLPWMPLLKWEIK